VSEAETPPAQEYIGLVTRAIAFSLDAVIINAVAIVVEGAGALAVSVFHLPKDVKSILIVLGGAAYIIWTVAYFATFWSTTGQTPGARVMQIRVVTNGGAVGLRRAVIRCIGMVLAALPLFAGYILIVFDARRRGLQDRFAGTLVVDAPQSSLAAQRREERRDTRTGEQRAAGY
jgi:uncharacterized RDD family membrane protein YckC